MGAFAVAACSEGCTAGWAMFGAGVWAASPVEETKARARNNAKKRRKISMQGV
jgi:hypothetical protein